MPTNGLAVVIVSWNVKQLLASCLDSLASEIRSVSTPVEVWVLDNDSSDSTPDMISNDFPWVRLICPGANLGYVQGNNLVLRRILESEPPEFVWLLNPDTIVNAGSTEAMIGFLTKHPRAGLIGPKLLNPDGSLQESAFRFPGLVQLMFDLGLLPIRLYHSRLNGRYPRRAYTQMEPFRVDHPLGAAMMSRTSAIRHTGLLDEGFFMYCEEIDWAWRMKRNGWTSWLVPQATVVHYGGASSVQDKPASQARLWTSRARLYRKHRNRWQYAIARALVRRTFRAAPALSAEWSAAHESIIEAWSA